MQSQLLLSNVLLVSLNLRRAYLVDSAGAASSPERLRGWLSSILSPPLLRNTILLLVCGQTFVCSRALLAGAISAFSDGPPPVVLVNGLMKAPSCLGSDGSKELGATWRRHFGAALAEMARTIAPSSPAASESASIATVSMPTPPGCDAVALIGWLCGFPVLYDAITIAACAPTLSSRTQTPGQACGAAGAAATAACGAVSSLEKSGREPSGASASTFPPIDDPAADVGDFREATKKRRGAKRDGFTTSSSSTSVAARGGGSVAVSPESSGGNCLGGQSLLLFRIHSTWRAGRPEAGSTRGEMGAQKLPPCTWGFSVPELLMSADESDALLDCLSERRRLGSEDGERAAKSPLGAIGGSPIPAPSGVFLALRAFVESVCSEDGSGERAATFRVTAERVRLDLVAL